MKKISTAFLLILIFFNGYDLLAQNNCLNFDGTNDYVNCGFAQSSLGNNFTIEAWVYPETATSYKGVAGPHYGNQGIAFLQYDGSSWLCGIGDGSGWNNAAISLPLNEWSHFTMTVSGGTDVKLYINGVLTAQSTSVSTFVPYGSSFWIGKSYDDVNRYFDGKIDEFRVWTETRTEDQIRQNMYQEIPNPSSETNLLGYYQFNETSGLTADNSEGTISNDGTLTNMAGTEWQTSSAIFGPKNALDFDGTNDYVDISNLKLGGSAITLETWLYMETFNGAADANISNIIRGGNERICLRIGDGGLPNNQPQFVMDLGSGQQKCNANTTLNANTWYHIACVYDGSLMKIYINGKLDNSLGQTGSYTASTTEGFILGANPDQSRALDGFLDEVRIWSDARTAEEIRDNMCKNLTGNESDLIVYYSFDNNSGTTLQNIVSNNYNGTLTNMDDADWISSTAFNTWLNTSSTTWATATNWSNGIPASGDNVSIYNYTNEPNIPSSQTFDNLYLGSGITSALGGNITVNGNLIINENLDLNGSTISLGTSAYLFEDDGLIYGSSGSITTTRTLSNIDENIAGLGAEITTSANMGSTTITRTHNPNSSPASIKRMYSITPTNNSGLNATLVFNYDDSELNGLSNSSLELYRSTDGGTNWTDFNGSVYTFTNTITLSGISSFSLWTAMESAGIVSQIMNTQDPSHEFFDGSPAIVIAPDATVTSPIDLENATVSISPIVTEDILAVSGLPAGLSSSWDNTAKILSISGTASAADYQTALRNVTFTTSSITSTETRKIDFILGDGVGLMIDGQQHFYEVIDNGSNISWDNARSNALDSRFGAAQGYLATITSLSENSYLAAKVSDDTWIGANDADTEGIWKWTDGPEHGLHFWTGDLNAGTSSTSNYGSVVAGEYEHWAGSEPNNSYTSYGEDCAHMYGSNRGANAGYWNDYWTSYNVRYYIVEYGGDGTTFSTIDDATITIKGAPGNALEFDGIDDYVDLNSLTSQLSATSDYTVECWINGDDISASSGDQTLWSINGPTGNPDADIVRLILENNILTLYDGSSTSYSTAKNLEQNKWYHVSFVKSTDNSFVLYLNGVQVLSGDQSTSIPSGNTFSLGQEWDASTSDHFDGRMDELRLWDDVRTQTEVHYNMCKAIEGNEAGLIAYYNFDNSEGLILSDVTSSGYNGTLNNMVNPWVNSGAFTTWLGAADSDWTDSTNWTSGVPIASSNVGIYSGTYNPSLSDTPDLDNMVIGSSKTLTITSNLSLEDNLIMYSNLNLSDYILDFGNSGHLYEIGGILTASSGYATYTNSKNNISNEDIAGLGAEITTTADIGSTTIQRYHSIILGESINRYYIINPSNNSSLNATLVFHYDDSELNGNTESQLVLYKSVNNGLTWSAVGGTVNTIENTITFSGISSFSWWTAAESGSVLPVEFLSFDGEFLSTDKSLLNWVTASEENSSHFMIQRSFDCQSFTTIGEINAAGNSNEIRNYQFEDDNATADIIYYRLKQIDYDGDFDYSKTIVLTKENNYDIEVSVYPNPIQNDFSVRFSSEQENINIEIIDASGRKIYEESHDFVSSVTINSESFKDGIYMLKISTNNNVDYFQIVK